MLCRPARELLRTITLAEFNGYMRLMLDRQRDEAEAEAEAEKDDEPEIDTALLDDDQVAALFGTRVR